jgi:hypothetical protein
MWSLMVAATSLMWQPQKVTFDLSTFARAQISNEPMLAIPRTFDSKSASLCHGTVAIIDVKRGYHRITSSP